MFMKGKGKDGGGDKGKSGPVELPTIDTAAVPAESDITRAQGRRNARRAAIVEEARAAEAQGGATATTDAAATATAKPDEPKGYRPVAMGEVPTISTVDPSTYLQNYAGRQFSLYSRGNGG
jgi:hypothetical protein